MTKSIDDEMLRFLRKLQDLGGSASPRALVQNGVSADRPQGRARERCKACKFASFDRIAWHLEDAGREVLR